VTRAELARSLFHLQLSLSFRFVRKRRRMRKLLEKVLVAMLVFSALATASGKSELKLLYDQHRWFDLREAMKRNEQNVPELYLGAVASAFNNREDAEKSYAWFCSHTNNHDLFSELWRPYRGKKSLVVRCRAT
jgi:hypothetical protein